MMFQIRNEHTASANMAVSYSRDGVNFGAQQQVSGTIPYTHNIGVRPDAQGYLISSLPLQTMFGMPLGGQTNGSSDYEWDLMTLYLY